MYVVKVGNMYVRAFDMKSNEIVLSTEIMRNFNRSVARRIAYLCNGTVIEMTEDTTNE